MIRKSLLFVVLAIGLVTAGAGSGVLPAVPGASFATVPAGSGNEVVFDSQASAEPIVYYYIAEWTWHIPDPDDPISYWSTRFPDYTVGTIDLRNLVQMAQSGGPDQCCMLLATSTIETSSPDLVYLGTNIDTVIFNIKSVESLLGQGIFTRETISGIVREMLGVKSDPLGQTGPKPLIPNGRRVITANIGDVRLFTDTISTGSVEWDKAMRVLQDDYDLIKSADPDLALKVAGYWLMKYGFDIRTVVQQVDGISAPETIIGDTFVEVSNTQLRDHTATGPNGGFGWADLNNGATVFGATDDVTGNSGVGDNLVRAESDLSSSDHYVQVEVITVPVSGNDVGVIGRKDSTATLTYYLALNAENTDYFLYKSVAGSLSVIGGPVSETIDPNDVLKLEMNGTTIRLLENDIEKISVTDSSITVGVRSGLRMFRNVARVDNWEAADLAVAALRRIFIFHN